MSTKYIILSIVGALVIGGAFGRYSLPAKVEVHTVAVVDTNTTKDDKSVIVETKTTKPDGTITVVTKIDKNVNTDVVKHSDVTTDKETTYDTSRITITALVLAQPLSGPNNALAYGVEASYKLLGPISVSALAASNGLIGVGIGISF